MSKIDASQRIRNIVNTARDNYAYPGATPCDEYEDAIKSDLKQLIQDIVGSIIGEDEHLIMGVYNDTRKIGARNELRFEQRSRIKL